ncbi:MAG: hypothetical protein KDE14_06395 [Rhodobacteraceae bacterium]|nr:hypothetical protein [Paracoccaceae bacterium]
MRIRHAAACAIFMFLVADLGSTPAQAVDVTNKSGQTVKITVTSADGQKSVTIRAGETLTAVCDACTIENDSGTKRDASGGQMVTLAGSLLLVSGQP